MEEYIAPVNARVFSFQQLLLKDYLFGWGQFCATIHGFLWCMISGANELWQIMQSIQAFESNQTFKVIWRLKKRYSFFKYHIAWKSSISFKRLNLLFFLEGTISGHIKGTVKGYDEGTAECRIDGKIEVVG